jgi:alpha-L-rhamnosidase
VHYDSIHCRIECDWKRTKGKFELTTDIPANTSAMVYLPADRADQITKSGRPLAKVAGVTLLRWDAGCAMISVKSGEYRFVSQFNQ